MRKFFLYFTFSLLVFFVLPQKSAAQSEADGFTMINQSCTTLLDCPQNLPSGSKVKCLSSKCYLDTAIGYQYFQKGQIGFLSVEKQIELKKPFLQIRIPGLVFTDVKNTLDADGYIHIPFLGQYLAALYKFAVGISSVVAVIVIILNGFRIVVSAGGDEKGKGIKKVTQALTGLIVLWGSYALFYTINPNLIQFKALSVKYVEIPPLPEESDNIEPEVFTPPPGTTKPTWTAQDFDCSKKDSYLPAGVADLSTIETYTCDGINGEIRTIKEMKDPLCEVASKAKQAGYSFNIVPGGSYRDFKTQVDGWCGKDAQRYPNPLDRKKFRAVPGFSNHGKGNAVDLILVKNGSQLFTTMPRDAQCDVSPQLVTQMAGFFSGDPKWSRLQTEIWHFEYGTNGTLYTTKPSFCK